MIKTRSYRGKGAEVVLVGFEETCCLGYAKDKHQWFKEGTQNLVELALRMGILEFQESPQGNRKLYEIKALPTDLHQLPVALEKSQLRVLNETSADEVADFSRRWGPYIRAHTGVRQLNADNSSFDPLHFKTIQIKRKRCENLTQEHLAFLQSLDLQLEEIEKVGDVYHVTVVTVAHHPFPFAVDFGGPLPTGWRVDNLGLPPKEVRKMNMALLMMYDTAYRILLNSTLHPTQSTFKQFFDPKKISLHAPTGIGPMNEIESMGFSTFRGESAKPKQLSHSLANTILGYLAPALNIKGKISTHVGACESVMGGIGDAFRDLKLDDYQAALVVGYDWAMTATAYNGFVANGAMITNEQLLKVAKKMIEDGTLTDADLVAAVNQRFENEQRILAASAQVDQKVKSQEISRENGREEKTRLQNERLQNHLSLPKRLYELASMPFHKYRSGFVMSIGAGGCFMTTLETAVKEGLPIKALVSGVGEKIPDGAGDGYGSIAVLGDGVGDAFEKAFLETQSNYQMENAAGGFRETSIEDIGAWWAHGTSTPTNGFGERREIQRICEKYGRSQPIYLSGDKEIGHRIGGNFPSEACYILEERVIYPLKNYVLADEELDKTFPLTKIVGKAGVGAGKALPFQGEFIAINGAGFGKINSNIMLKTFRVEDLDIPEAAKKEYLAKCAARKEEMQILTQKIRRGETPLVVDTADTAKSRGEASDLTQSKAKRSAGNKA